jgi:hypothetical protein
VSPWTLDLRLSFDDLSVAFNDWSAQMLLACPFIFTSNSCQSDSIVVLYEAAASGSGLVSV